MIKRLRAKFIRITMLSVAVVLLVLSLIVNAANFIAASRDLDRMLDMICENQGNIPTDRIPGTLPTPPDGADTGDFTPPAKPEPPRGLFTAETPFSTRYFYLRFDTDGNLTGGDFSHIAAVTQADADAYLQAALRHGAGYGFYGGYRYRVADEGGGCYMAVFLDCHQELRSAQTLAIWTGVSYAVCLGLVYILVVLLSRRAIDPVVRAAEQQKQFITDAGHELKTPITVITTSL